MFNKKSHTCHAFHSLYISWMLMMCRLALSEPMYDTDETWHALSEVGRGDRVVSSSDRYKDGKIDVNP